MHGSTDDDERKSDEEEINQRITIEELQRTYSLALELVEAFLTLEENQDDDLSFFASPVKPRLAMVLPNGGL